ncbi:MAG: hypothetical protein ACK5WP_09520 [Neisseriaceae bacterium]|jgi:hypothetical protein
MTALQLILLNSILLGGCVLLAYLITHGRKKDSKKDSLNHQH